MFTGLVSEKGTVKRARARRNLLELEIEAPHAARGLHRGDSVAIDGVCLTAVSTGRRRFQVQAMSETLERSTLGGLERGRKVNIELAARLSDRLGGHLVQGHVDGQAEVVRVEDEGEARRVWFATGPDLLRYMVRKGSVTVNGVSLTVVDAGTSTFEVALIPHTLEATTLGELRVGSVANVEVDIIAKYVERLNGGHS